jgi:invasion protein IalB
MAALSRHAAVDEFGRGRGDVGALSDAVTARYRQLDRKDRLMTLFFGRLGAVTLAFGLAMAAGGAMAQTTPKAPAAPPAAPQQTGPIKLDLQPMQSPWTKICGKDPTGREVCYTTRDFGQGPDQPPTLAVAVYQMSGDEKRIARFLLPVALMLRPGFRLIIDNKGEPIEGRFAICFPNGCFAEAELNDKTIGALKKAQLASVIVRNQANAEVTFTLPMKEFGTAFDGPAIDPKVLEQQNQELQKQLEEKARVQREQLEKQSSQPAAPQPPK